MRIPDDTPPVLQALLIDVGGSRSQKLFELLEQLGIRLTPRSATDASLYQLIEQLRPDIIFVDVNSPARDTLEHVVSASDAMPKPVVRADDELRVGLRRLAGEIGISLYVTEALSPTLLQCLIDITISHCHSIETLKRELALHSQSAQSGPVAGMAAH